MPDIVKELNLNKHPKNIKNLSLVYAKNIRVSNDGSVIQNEESIFNHSVINNVLKNKILVGYISCSKEVILFVTNSKSSIGTSVPCSLFRYNELENTIKQVYDNYKYFGGTITGDYTYNVNNELILSISEYFDEIKYPNHPLIPLKTINLGKWEDINIVDYNLNYEQLTNNPIVKIPKFDFNYVNGKTYKGWYYIFIRYKINRNDYTNWFDLGYPVYINETEDITLIKYLHAYNETREGADNNTLLKGTGCRDFISTTDKVCQKTITCNLTFYDNNYSHYQLAFICTGKSFSKAFKTLDISIDKNEYKLDINTLETYSIEEIINYTFNVYNVKNVLNYKNKIYIANYYDNDYKNKISDFKVIADNLQLNIVESTYEINKTKWETIDDSFVHTFNNKMGGTGEFNEEEKLKNVDNNSSSFYTRLKNSTLIPGNCYRFFIHFVNKYGEYTEGFPIRNNMSDTKYKGFQTTNDQTTTIEPFVYTCDNYEYFVPFKELNENTEDKNILKRYTLEFNNINSLPTGYIGFYFSYQKYEPFRKITGYLSPLGFAPFAYHMNDGGNNDYDYPNLLDERPTSLRFYSNELYLDDINIQPTHICIYKDKFERDIGNVYFQDNNYYTYIKNFEKISRLKLTSANANEILENTEDYAFYPVSYCKYVKSDNSYEDNFDKSGYLKIKFSDDDRANQIYFNNIWVNNLEDCFKATLYDFSKKYISNSKKLIKFTNIYYIDENYSNTIDVGLNGRLTFTSALIFNIDGVKLLDGANTLTNSMGKFYFPVSKKDSSLNNTNLNILPFKAILPFVYAKMSTYSDIIIEGINFKRNKLYAAQVTESNSFVLSNVLILPSMLEDMFEERYGSQDDFNPRTYINYREDILFMDKFDKRIKRSNIIQDESFNNAWRKFNNEAYKDITENKGNITNLALFKDSLLIHTEHSLFILAKDEKLITDNSRINISSQDIFDIDYKEIINSNKGLAGLQDKKASISGDFGYVFFDNDSFAFYYFDEKGLNRIDTYINEWIYKYRPYQVRFADDKQRYRLLISIKYKDDAKNIYEKVLSYNYLLNSFISEHTYNFDESFSTKNNVYYIKNFNELNTKLYFVNDDFKGGNRTKELLSNEQFLINKHYGYFENNFIEDKNVNSQIDIIINDSYELIKYLEFIIYKLYEIQESALNGLSPVEEDIRIPYAGISIRVKNSLVNDIDMVDTGEVNVENAEYTLLDTSQDPMNYELPYWHNGNWNFNYLRNKLNELDSRIWGNYFIISIKFGRNNLKTEFETLAYYITKNEI